MLLFFVQRLCQSTNSCPLLNRSAKKFKIFSTSVLSLPSFSVQVRRQSLAGMTLHLQLPQPACLQPGFSRSPSRLHRQEHRGRARDRARVSKHRTRPSSTHLCPLATDTLVRKSQAVLNYEDSTHLFPVKSSELIYSFDYF